jgi:FixJ family two-component response regulator
LVDDTTNISCCEPAALQAGAVAFLSKPFNDQDLLDVLALGVG